MSNQVRDLLLNRPAEDNRVLFRSGLQLAGQIAELKFLPHFGRENAYCNKKQSVASYINQYFRDGRPLPVALREAVLEAVYQRLAAEPSEAQTQWVKRIEKALAQGPAISHAVGSGVIDPMIERALNIATTARDICLVYTWVEGKADLGRYREKMVAKLGLNDPDAEDVPARFTMFDPSAKWSREGWRKLYYQITGIADENPGYKPLADPEEAAKLLNRLDTSDILRTFAVPPFGNSVPMIIFEPLSETEMTGFVFIENQEARALELSPGLLEQWKWNYYRPIMSGEIEAQRVRFREVEEEVVAEAKSFFISHPRSEKQL